MDQSQLTNLTGVTIESEDQFDSLVEAATADLEELLGYPLDPNSWPNLYNETGKTQGFTCPDVDTDELTLDDADDVVGSYRLYTFRETDKYLAIDPATAIHAVKLVKDDVTYRTYEESEYRINWKNGSVKTAKYIELCDYPYPWYECWRDCNCLQLAVDATWAYEELPAALTNVLAQLVAEGAGGYVNSEVKTESRGSHSYTKFDRQDTLTRFPILRKYAGPNGTAYPTRPL